MGYYPTASQQNHLSTLSWQSFYFIRYKLPLCPHFILLSTLCNDNAAFYTHPFDVWGCHQLGGILQIFTLYLTDYKIQFLCYYGI